VELGGRENDGEYSVGAGVVGLLGGIAVEGRGEWEICGDWFGGSEVLLLHSEVAFTGG
jgi:hypothetical protein